jgi:hypothetical protein
MYWYAYTYTPTHTHAHTYTRTTMRQQGRWMTCNRRASDVQPPRSCRVTAAHLTRGPRLAIMGGIEEHCVLFSIFREHFLCTESTLCVSKTRSLCVRTCSYQYTRSVCARNGVCFCGKDGGGGGGEVSLTHTLSAIYNLCSEENASVGIFSSSE